jgi:hypothetical protein
MSRISGARPSPAMIVAVLALSFALVGSAVAGTGVLEKKVTKSKVKTIAKKQANKVLNNRESSLDVENAANLGGQPASAYALADSEAYHLIGTPGEPAFENGWSNFAAAYSKAAFYIDSMDVVHLRGSIQAAASGTIAFTLPAGYRPSENLFLPMAGGGPEAANLIINADGTVEPTCDTDPCTAGIDGLSFRVP